MTRIRWALAVPVALLAWQEAAAQPIVSYPWWTGARSYYSSGIGLNYYNRHLAVRGFFGNGIFVSSYPFYGSFYPPIPFGVVQNNITINVVSPPVVMSASARRLQELLDDINWQNDVSGVDLDRVGPEALERPARPGRRRIPDDDPPVRKPKLPEPEKVVPPVKEKDRPKPPEPKPPEIKKLPPKVKPPKVESPKSPWDLPPPKDNPREESERLRKLGIDLFQQQFYGVAAFRFRQALKVDPADGTPHFLLSQAEFALGSFRDAVATIKAGMKEQPNWPTMPFQKLELYKGMEGDFADQLKRLETAVAADPKNPDLLFLLGHVRWFAGQRDQAVLLFRQARAVSPDPAFIDRFLKIAAPGPLAAK